MLLMTAEGFKVTVEAYQEVSFKRTDSYAAGVLLVRDEQNRPMPIVAGYARIHGKYYLVPIIGTSRDDKDYTATLLFSADYIERVIVQSRQRTVIMLLTFGMFLDLPQHSIEATRTAFLRSPLYRNHVFWSEMWKGISTLISVLIEVLPSLGIDVLDERADAELKKYSLGRDHGEALIGKDLVAAQLGHLIGFSIGWDCLKRCYPIGSDISPEMARTILLEAGLIIRFPEWFRMRG